MSTTKELFSKAISEAFNAADKIIESKDKALAYAEIAKALASTGAIKSNDVNTEIPEKASLKSETAKTETKPEPKKLKKETKNEEKPQDPEIVDEWTDEMLEKFKPQSDKLGEFLNDYGEDAIKDCIEAFSEGQFKELEDITPSNIDAFLTYLEQLQEQA